VELNELKGLAEIMDFHQLSIFNFGAEEQKIVAAIQKVIETRTLNIHLTLMSSGLKTSPLMLLKKSTAC
jgi:hypothetical protein